MSKNRSRLQLARAILALASLFAAAGAGAVSLEEERHPVPDQVQTLPVLGRLGGQGQTQLVIRGRLATARASEALARIGALRADLERRFGPGEDRSQRPIQVCLFPTAGAYADFVGALIGPDTFQSDVGFFSPYRRLVAADLSRRADVLDHELTHALLIDLPGRLPYWADEGLASLYTGFSLEKGRLRFSPRHRLAELRAAKASGRLPDLDGLAASGDQDVYGPAWRGYYALGRFVLLYLAERGKLDAFVTDLRRAGLDPKRVRALLAEQVSPKDLWLFIDSLPQTD